MAQQSHLQALPQQQPPLSQFQQSQQSSQLQDHLKPQGQQETQSQQHDQNVPQHGSNSTNLIPPPMPSPKAIIHEATGVMIPVYDNVLGSYSWYPVDQYIKHHIQAGLATAAGSGSGGMLDLQAQLVLLQANYAKLQEHANSWKAEYIKMESAHRDLKKQNQQVRQALKAAKERDEAHEKSTKEKEETHNKGIKELEARLAAATEARKDTEIF